MSCAACRSAKGYRTSCPYCRAPGDLQRAETAAKAADLSVQERIAAALEKLASCVDNGEFVIRVVDAYAKSSYET